MLNVYAMWKRTVACMLGAAALVATVAIAGAEPSSPQAFVDSIYKQYLAKDSKGVSLGTEAEIRRYFTGQLADAIAKDFAAAHKAGEVPLLNGDPFIDAQDWEISNVKSVVESTGDKTALATVTFAIFMKAHSMRLHLVNTADGWRIEEILGPSGSLRALYKLR